MVALSFVVASGALACCCYHMYYVQRKPALNEHSLCMYRKTVCVYMYRNNKRDGANAPPLLEEKPKNRKDIYLVGCSRDLHNGRGGGGGAEEKPKHRKKSMWLRLLERSRRDRSKNTACCYDVRSTCVYLFVLCV